MQNNNKKPIMINLVAALILCLVTFIIGFSISSVVLLDSRIESANEKISDLNVKLDEKDAEIKELNKTIDQKNENNVSLAEKIQEQAAVIEKLNSNVSSLEHDVASISEAAINSQGNGGNPAVGSLADLTITQQLILFVILLVLLIFIVSATCAIIAVKSPAAKNGKPKKRAKTADEAYLPEPASETEALSDDLENELNSTADPTDEASEELAPDLSSESNLIPSVTEAIDLLYHNNLEDSISELGGFKFGITNFDEILSDKSRSKAFGNCENGDFVAFMSSSSTVKKLYIIPRYLTLSDSTVALRGTTDLFSVTDESGNKVTNGTVRIKSIDSPAVFACGENGWAIEAKGAISALGSKTI